MVPGLKEIIDARAKDFYFGMARGFQQFSEEWSHPESILLA
jgi:hypothetical protein